MAFSNAGQRRRFEVGDFSESGRTKNDGDRDEVMNLSGRCVFPTPASDKPLALSLNLYVAPRPGTRWIHRSIPHF
jgi:hypothetical protein